MNTNRVELYKQLPLETPFSIHIFPSYYCNFRCNYCLHSLSKEELEKKRFYKQYMDMNVFCKAIDGVKEFNNNVKALVFAGHGEPLLHPNIAEMVAYAKKTGKFDRIEIVTNGAMLTYELSDKLISAGLDRLRISLQGVNADKYREVSNTVIDIDKYIDRLRYFYEHKIDTEVYIKIIDVALDNKEEEKEFYDIFSMISDITAIEYAIPFVKEIDYSNVGELSNKCKQGHKHISNICSMPFYMMVVQPNGDVVPCCSTDVPMIFGNVKKKSMKEIWDSKIHYLCMKRQLGGVDKIPICKECSVPAFGLQEGDYLDGYEEDILKKYT